MLDKKTNMYSKFESGVLLGPECETTASDAEPSASYQSLEGKEIKS